jgi:DNA-binding Lrp family transcriptional regulator
MMSLDEGLISRLAEACGKSRAEVRERLRELDEANIRLRAIAEFKHPLSFGIDDEAFAGMTVQ